MADEIKNNETNKNDNMAQVKAKEEVEKLLKELNRIKQEIKTIESREPLDLNRREELMEEHNKCVKKLEELGVHYDPNKNSISDKEEGPGDNKKEKPGTKKEEPKEEKEEPEEEKEESENEKKPKKEQNEEQIDGRTIKPLSFWEGRAGIIILPRQENAEMTMVDFVNKMNDPKTVTIIKEMGKLDDFVKNFNGGEGTESIPAAQIWNGVKNSEKAVVEMMNANNGKLPIDNIDSDDCILIDRPSDKVLKDEEHNGKFTQGDLIKPEIMEKLPPEVAKECEPLTLEEMKTKYENKMKQEEVKDENNEVISDENNEENKEPPIINGIGENVTRKALNGVSIVIANSLEYGLGPKGNEYGKEEAIREIIPPSTT